MSSWAELPRESAFVLLGTLFIGAWCQQNILVRYAKEQILVQYMLYKLQKPLYDITVSHQFVDKIGLPMAEIHSRTSHNWVGCDLESKSYAVHLLLLNSIKLPLVVVTSAFSGIYRTIVQRLTLLSARRVGSHVTRDREPNTEHVCGRYWRSRMATNRLPNENDQWGNHD